MSTSKLLKSFWVPRGWRELKRGEIIRNGDCWGGYDSDFGKVPPKIYGPISDKNPASRGEGYDYPKEHATHIRKRAAKRSASTPLPPGGAKEPK